MKYYLPLGVLVVANGFGTLHCSYASELEKHNNIEVIQVHAKKRAIAYKNTTSNLSIYTSRELEQLNLKDSTQLSSLAPNVKITQNAAEGTPPSISIRGVSLLDYNTGNTSPVGIYVDDIVGGSVNNQIVNLFDMEQVEILKGPQGTQFGRNTNGGAILLYSKKPTDKLEGYAIAGKGNNNQSKLEGAFNLPLSDDTRLRFSAQLLDYDYSTNNLYLQSPVAGLKQKNYRAILTHQADKLDLMFKLHMEDWRGTVNPPGNIGVIAAFDENGAPSAYCSPKEAGSTDCFDAFGFNSGSNDFHTVNVDNHSPHNTDSWGSSLHLNYNLTDKIKLISLSGFNSLERLSGFNCDASPSKLCQGALGVEDDAFSQEFRLELDLDDAFISLGTFYLNESIHQDNFNDLFRDFRGTGLVDNQFTTKFLYDNQLDIQSLAVFADLDFALTDDFYLSVGARYTDELTEYTAHSDADTVLDNSLNDDAILASIQCVKGSVEYDTSFDAVCLNWDLSGKVKSDHLSGNLALRYELDTNTNLYYRIAKGFKSGGYNGGLIFSQEEAENAEYGAEELLAHEIGIKTNTAFWRTFIQASVFWYDYKDQQIFINQASAIEGNPPLQLLDNAGESEIYGLELDLYTAPVKPLIIRFGVGYLPEAQAHYDDGAGQTLSKRLPLASEWNVSTSFNYRFEKLSTQLDFEYQSDFYFDQNENPYTRQDDLLLVNGQLDYAITNALTVSLWGKNLTDEEYSHLRFDLTNFLGMLEDFKADGRRYGIEVRLSL